LTLPDFAQNTQKKTSKKLKKSIAIVDPGKPAIAEIYEKIRLIIDRDSLYSSYPEFPNRYFVINDLTDGRHIVREYKGEIRYTSETAIISDIMTYCDESGLFGPQTHSFCRQAYLYWSHRTKPIPMPEYIVDRDCEKRAFARLGFNSHPGEFAGWPASWQSILDRVSQPDALCAFIGSLFYPDADRQQYLFCFGAGQDSKGTMIRFLHNLLGSSCQFIEAPERGDRFFNFKLVGKRVGIMADCDSPKFFGSAKFKTLTGGDPIYIEQKGKDGYTMNLQTKFIVASNAYPELSGEKSDIRRVIFVEFEGVPDSLRVAHFENMLLKDAESIVKGCKAKYLSMCPHHSPIDCEVPQDVIDECERHYLNILEENFLITGKSSDEISAADVQRCLSHHRINGGRNVKKVKDVWFRAYPGIRQLQGGRQGRRYTGMRFKDFTAKRFTNNNLSLIEPGDE